MANATFGAADFDIDWQNPFTIPLPPQRHTLAIRKVPYGSRTIAQDLGKEATEISYRVYLTIAEYGVIVPLIGTTATLDIDGDQVRTGVLLQSIDGIERDDTHDVVEATLSFLVP